MNVVEDRTLVCIYLYNQHSEDNHEDKLKLKTNQMRRHSKCNAMRKTLQTEEFGGGVTQRIGSIRPRHGAQLSWHSEVKFRINVFTLGVYVSID